MRNDKENVLESKEGITITARCGKIRGLTITSEFSKKMYFSFLGVPYAVPPLGHLRFERWSDVYIADTNKECIQYSLFEHKLLGSEDCLYLNIHIPEIPTKKGPLLPVVVMIHFGGLIWGSGSTECIGSADFLMHCGIVYVTICFRLHIFGFLNLNSHQCPGNMGLKDIELALRWIQQNIKYFGGDPNNVTLIGSSSGSVQIHMLMMIRSCKSLFHKVIVMGMYAIHPCIHYPLDPEEEAFRLGRAMGFMGQSQNELHHFLKYAPTALFLNPLKDINFSLTEREKKVLVSSPFLPTFGSVDGFLPKMPENMTKLENPVPVIYGICDHEVPTLFLPKYRKFFDEDFHQTIRQSCYLWLHQLDEDETKEIENEINRKYSENDVTKASQVFTDLIAMEFYHTLADVLHKTNEDIPIFIYKFQYENSLNDFTNLVRSRSVEKLKGSFHSDDFFYWMRRSNPLTKTDEHLVQLITKLFCNFAKTGNPNEQNQSFIWKASTKENPCYIRIAGEETSITPELRNGRLNEDGVLFWEALKKKFTGDSTEINSENHNL